MNSENLGNFVRFWSKTLPNRAAVVDGGVIATWADLDRDTSRLANGLLQQGLKKGERIGILAPNCLDYLRVVIVACRVGLITVPLNHRLTAAELRYIVGHSGCRVVIAHPDFFGPAAQALDDLQSEAAGPEVLRVGMEEGFGIVLAGLFSAEVVDHDAAHWIRRCCLHVLHERDDRSA